jgi:glutamyl-tRNA(Gln) amidotransferase subunit E
MGWALPGFEGLLKGKLGPEFAAHARIAGFAGIFHSDELPGYGITPAEVEAVREALGAKAKDAFVLVAGDPSNARTAMEEMASRATAAIEGVPPETREPRPDGTTVYSRPLPGKARMYPETDVPPIRVSQERLDSIREALPDPPEVTIERLSREYGIHGQQARQLLTEGMDELFEIIAREFGEPKLVATVLLYNFSELRRESLNVDGIPVDHLRELFSLLKAGRFAKEALPDLLREMARRGVRASEAIASLGVKGLTRRHLEEIVDAVLEESADLIAARKEGAEKPLMGRLMERVRGRADGKLVSDVLHERLAGRLRDTKKRERKEKR